MQTIQINTDGRPPPEGGEAYLMPDGCRRKFDQWLDMIWMEKILHP